MAKPFLDVLGNPQPKGKRGKKRPDWFNNPMLKDSPKEQRARVKAMKLKDPTWGRLL
jgi:hypothetical protein